MTDSRVLLSTSRADSLPMSILQAGASGCGVVASPVGAVTEILSDGRGVLVRGTSDRWVKEILAYLDSMNPECEPNPRLRKYIETKYSHDAMVSALRRVYTQVLDC